MTEQELLDKISMLVAQRENFLINANQTIGNFNGQITVYQALLNDMRQKNDQKGSNSNDNQSVGQVPQSTPENENSSAPDVLGIGASNGRPTG